MAHSRFLSAVFLGTLIVTPSLVFAGDSDSRNIRLERNRANLSASMKARGPGAVGLETQEELLGSLLYSDKNLSLNRNQACSSCHELRPAIDAASGKPLPTPGFVDPDNVTNGTPVSVGSIRTLTGGLNTPSAGYAAFSPFFHWDANEGLYVGGQFWDGRAATLQAQAGGPFLNPVEMAMASKWAVIARLQENSNYLSLFKKVYDIQLDQIPGNEHELLNTTPPPGVFAAYDALTKAIAAFEKSRVFNRFTSKFDYYLAGKTQLTAQEQRGLVSFNGKAKCSACHISTPGIAPGGGVLPPLFTDFTYDNIGTPRNVNIPGNPAPGMGLGGRADIAARDPAGAEIGKHKVMSLRNIAVTAPYGHNGVFKTLEQTVHFYNTRDTLTRLADNNDPNFGITGWPSPEFSQNLNVVELGNLGLSAAEEADVVAFMRTLTDGYPEWGEDKNVPSGTPSPFAETLFPPFP